MSSKPIQNNFNEYKKTIILFTILLAVMSLILFIPLKNNKEDHAGITTSLQK
jgi:hypothetical protein